MQVMTWQIARLGSRFGLLFEPYRNQVRHSALGRFLDQPLDLLVGIKTPDGQTRALPFTQDPDTVPLDNPELFDRFNSVTWRAHCAEYALRFEFNIHSVFYPQDEPLCTMPVFYLELRVSPIDNYRWHRPPDKNPRSVTAVLRLKRPDTVITADGSALDLRYQNTLTPKNVYRHPTHDEFNHEFAQRTVDVQERLLSLNPDTQALPEGDGLALELPVTEIGSGIKWRLTWGAFVNDPVLRVKSADGPADARFLYSDQYDSLDAVMDDAVRSRDDRLMHSRRFEKLIEQAPLDVAQTHLLNQSWQSYLANTWWCTTEATRNPTDPKPRGTREPWFSVWEGASFFHSTVDVEYNVALLYLALWPKLLRLQLEQWTRFLVPHEPSGGAYLAHDTGAGPIALEPDYPHPMPVEESANFLLLLHTYAHWTGDKALPLRLPHLVRRLAAYLLWTDREGTGFPTEGTANTLADASPACQFARKQTYLAVKRLAALRAAAGLLALSDDAEYAPFAKRCEAQIDADAPKIEDAAWLGDHYAVTADRSAIGLLDPNTGLPLPFDTLEGWDAYSIYTGNGLLLPLMIGRPPILHTDRLRKDVLAADRENQSRYGDGHTSAQVENLRISQNLWRDMLARYLDLKGPSSAAQYWDLQLMSNTHQQSLGFCDTYVNNFLCHYPRGITAIGYYLASPTLVIDRLAPGSQGTYITVDPDRSLPQRWPLLPLADWKAGKIPVCVVDDRGRVSIEGQIDPVIIQGESAPELQGSDLIG
ncbi:MAG: DUF4965 domain-containing protein [Planctomycetota bacterium]